MIWYGQFNPQVDKVLFMNYFENQKHGTFLECGAADGISLSCAKTFEEIGWVGINIEGMDVNFRKLLEYRPRSLLNLHAALSNIDGYAIFSNETIKKQLGENEKSDLPSIPSIRLQTVMKQAGVKTLDLLCLDIEGYEPVVLGDLPEPLPKVICVEYPHCGLEEIKNILLPKYRLDGLSFCNAFFSLPNVPARNPFWGRTKEWVRGPDGMWVIPDKVEY